MATREIAAMTTFDEREHSYERKFQQEQELAFKVKSRRHKLIGLWAAAQMKLEGDAAEAYASDLVAVGLAHQGDAATVARIERDFAAKDIKLDAHRIRLELVHCENEAKKEMGAPS